MYYMHPHNVRMKPQPHGTKSVFATKKGELKPELTIEYGFVWPDTIPKPCVC